MFENLESRRMMSVTAKVETVLWYSGEYVTALHVVGDSSSNNILVKSDGGSNIIEKNGTSTVNVSGRSSVAASRFQHILVEGKDGNDRIEISNAAATRVTKSTLIKGGNGNDNMRGGGGVDYLAGESGSDTADYSHRGVPIRIQLGQQWASGSVARVDYGGPVGDTDTVFAENARGGSAADFITGTDSANKLYGGGGNDTISGYDGNDTIYGGDGDDTLEGYGGNDVLYGDAGQDDLFGDEGSDTLYGGDGADYLYSDRSGGRYLDRLDGNGGTDTARQWDSDDVLTSIEAYA